MAAQEAVFARISNAIGVQKLYLRVGPVVSNLWLEQRKFLICGFGELLHFGGKSSCL